MGNINSEKTEHKQKKTNKQKKTKKKKRQDIAKLKSQN